MEGDYIERLELSIARRIESLRDDLVLRTNYLEREIDSLKNDVRDLERQLDSVKRL